MKKVLRWFLLLLVAGLCGLVLYAYNWVRQYRALADEEPAVAILPDVADLVYCSPGGVPLSMDLYFPEQGAAPWQVLVYVHGGSFTGGDKRQGSGMIDIPALTARGYVVAAINYRRMPDNPFPAEVLDARCAVRFLRANAEKYQLRTDKMGIWGGSAGGHLASMVGLTNHDPAFDAGEYPDQPSRGDAVVEMFGPTDLTAPMGWLQRWLLRRAFGTDNPADPLLARASPVLYVNTDAPPFLILHGEQDDAVPVVQAQLLQDKLTAAGVNSTLVIVKNANHNFKPTGGAIQPGREEISGMVADFFDLWLKQE
ncbi:MAG TPA: alpha/beta hydrolase [Anaerolinea sp.]|nr:alpha/beta hydrolase [Anaerolinea sp.]